MTSFKMASGICSAGPCITNVFATCRKNFSQWHRSFQRKLRSHWLKFLRHVAITLVIQDPVVQCNLCIAYYAIMQYWNVTRSMIMTSTGHSSHYQLTKELANQAIIWTNVNLSSMGFCGTYLRPISLEVFKISVHKVSLKNTLVIWETHL